MADGPNAQGGGRAIEDAAAEITLEHMRAWCADRGLVATQRREGCCIWVEGDSKPYAEELRGMGFRFTGKRKSWYIDAGSAA